MGDPFGATPPNLEPAAVHRVQSEEGWILGVTASPVTALGWPCWWMRVQAPRRCNPVQGSTASLASTAILAI